MRELDVNLSSVPKRIRHYVPFEVSRIVFARPARRKSTLTPRFSIYSIVERNRVIVTVSQNLEQNFSLLFEYIYVYIYLWIFSIKNWKIFEISEIINKSWMCEIFEIWKYFSRTELILMTFFFLSVFKIFLVEFPRRRGLRNKKYRQFFTSWKS